MEVIGGVGVVGTLPDVVPVLEVFEGKLLLLSLVVAELGGKLPRFAAVSAVIVQHSEAHPAEQEMSQRKKNQREWDLESQRWNDCEGGIR